MIPLDRILLSSLMLLSVQSAHAVEGQKVFTQGGAQPAAMACVSCHGADGMGLAAAGFPRLAGLPAGYLSKQLEDFRSGSRTSPVMQPLAKALAEDEIRAVTQTLAAMPVPATPAISRSATPNGLGERLALRGAWDRQVPECVTCHGPGGVGVGQTFPPLAGQSAAYLTAQLNAWRDGEQHPERGFLTECPHGQCRRRRRRRGRTCVGRRTRVCRPGIYAGGERRSTVSASRSRRTRCTQCIRFRRRRMPPAHERTSDSGAFSGEGSAANVGCAARSRSSRALSERNSASVPSRPR